MVREQSISEYGPKQPHTHADGHRTTNTASFTRVRQALTSGGKLGLYLPWATASIPTSPSPTSRSSPLPGCECPWLRLDAKTNKGGKRARVTGQDSAASIATHVGMGPSSRKTRVGGHTPPKETTTSITQLEQNNFHSACDPSSLLHTCLTRPRGS
ncbi:hypothetical protein E2C01_003886 [Portunus trituberculatus]|uniref:Uncharacterized protein n=1 Tax=Portunus trituberculatus TaxID=210409 RepID=A0A5B7CPU8_PORTR|nr:hypothetical protein [Portunus trituberculatus]